MSQDQFNISKFLKETQSGPYGVIKKTSSKKKSKKSLNENYIDLMPIGGGNTFKGYTNDLREDETYYLGPKKPAPDKIYATDNDFDDLKEVPDNPWMKKLTTRNIGNFIVNYDYPGIITWTPKDMDGHNEGDFYIAATPQWDNEPGTPIQVIYPNGVTKTGEDFIPLKSLKQDKFNSFEEYAETIYPIIKKWMDQNNHEEFEEGLEDEHFADGDGLYHAAGHEDHVPTFGSNAKNQSDLGNMVDEEDFEDHSEINKYDRFWDLGGREIYKAVEYLLNDGFELQDIIDYITTF